MIEKDMMIMSMMTKKRREVEKKAKKNREKDAKKGEKKKEQKMKEKGAKNVIKSSRAIKLVSSELRIDAADRPRRFYRFLSP
jgi:hypothetical protein